MDNNFFPVLKDLMFLVLFAAIRQATLMTNHTVYLKTSKKRRPLYTIGKLSPGSPNLKIQLLFDEDVEFQVEGPSGAAVYVVGNITK